MPLPTLPDTGDPLFDRALAVVLEHEGGYCNDAGDPGGPTNFGISLRLAHSLTGIDLDLDHDGDVDADDIRRLTVVDVARVYRAQWWDRYTYTAFHLTVAIKVFDLAVNMGAVQAHKVAQRACRAASGVALSEDGVLGPKTALAINAIDPAMLVVALRAEAAGFYRSLVASKPNFEKFLNGWLNRAYS